MIIKLGSTTQLKMNSYFIEIEKKRKKENKRDRSKEKG